MKAAPIHRHRDPHPPHTLYPLPGIIPNPELENGATANKPSSTIQSPHTLNSSNGPEVGAPKIQFVLVVAESTLIEG
jgi:hypothetical protein